MLSRCISAKMMGCTHAVYTNPVASAVVDLLAAAVDGSRQRAQNLADLPRSIGEGVSTMINDQHHGFASLAGYTHFLDLACERAMTVQAKSKFGAWMEPTLVGVLCLRVRL